jgi:hypothetical protein
MKKTVTVFLVLIVLFASGCASAPKQDNTAGNFTEKERKEQVISVNILDTLLGAGIGLLAGTLCGGFITIGTGGTPWFDDFDSRFYIPVFTGVLAGGFTGWLLSPKYEEQKDLP